MGGLFVMLSIKYEVVRKDELKIVTSVYTSATKSCAKIFSVLLYYMKKIRHYLAKAYNFLYKFDLILFFSSWSRSDIKKKFFFNSF